MTEIFDQARLHLPKYLSPSRQDELYDSLKQFPDFPQFYLPPEEIRHDLLQGDGWQGFVVHEFDSGRSKTVSGIVLSNSCDIETDNPSHHPRKVLFSPLIPLGNYERALLSAGAKPEQIASQFADIRAQRVTEIFYLPGGTYGPPECIALLDDVHPHPLAHFKEARRSLLFRLHQAAFYLFVIKLSIHFCRLQEGVARFSV